MQDNETSVSSDTDGDLLLDGQEKGLSVPQTPDTDFNLVPDAQPVTTTDPLDADSDDDGLEDGQEDLDLDGGVDAQESDPSMFDTDGDGLSDGLEAGVTQATPDTNPLYLWQMQIAVQLQIQL